MREPGRPPGPPQRPKGGINTATPRNAGILQNLRFEMAIIFFKRKFSMTARYREGSAFDAWVESIFAGYAGRGVSKLIRCRRCLGRGRKITDG